MSEENEPKEIEPKGSRILFCYFVVVLLLGLVAVGILFRAFDTAFVERDKWMKVAESQKRPNRLVLPGRGNIYSSDGKLMATSVPRYYMYIDFKADAYTPAKMPSIIGWIRSRRPRRMGWTRWRFIFPVN